jgi:predicted nucleotidyltransferase
MGLVDWMQTTAGRRRPDIQAAVRQMAEAYQEVDAVYLFGSLARGSGRDGSDVDLAVSLNSFDPDRDRIDMQAELAAYLEARLGVPVDVVVLDSGLSPGLLFDIFAVETILYARDYEQAHARACRARAEYRDLLPRRERAFERLRRRIEERANALNRA